MRLVLIRHYKTKFNASGQIMGWGDSPEVEEWQDDLVFIEQALVAQEVTPDAVYTSALGRARRTGNYFAKKLGQRCACHDPQLNEVNYGKLTEKSKKWVTAHYPLHKKDPDFVYPKGESFRQMQTRCVHFVNQLASERQGETLLCVAHAGVIRALVSHFQQLDFAPQLKRRISHRYIGVLSFDHAPGTGYQEWGEPSGFILEGAIPPVCSEARASSASS
jgi:broad specificity phosphatase PhoE